MEGKGEREGLGVGVEHPARGHQLPPRAQRHSHPELKTGPATNEPKPAGVQPVSVCHSAGQRVAEAMQETSM